METPPPLSVPPPASKPDGTEKLFIILCHLSLFLGLGVIVPLIVYLVKKGEHENTAAHAREALNFQLSLLIYCAGAFILCMIFIGFPLFIAIGLMSVVLPIVAAVKASDGVLYRYPLCIRLVT
jgi:uncharacterized Tic20 family protein